MAIKEVSPAGVGRRRGPGLFSRIELSVELASDEAVSCRSLGALFLAGGILSLVTIPLSSAKDYHSVAVAVIGLIAVSVGSTLCWRPAALSARFTSAVLALGTLLITLVVIASGQPAGGYNLFYAWVALQAFYFLGPRAVALHMAGVALGYGVALIVVHGGVAEWLLLLGTAGTTGWLTGALRARIQRLSRQSRTDALTGLENRRGFDENIEMALARARSGHQRLALVVFDLDRLKVVNDRYGHLAGDAVLRRVAQLCVETVELSAARLGGDEFAIIASDCDQRAATELACCIHEAVRRAPELARYDVTISTGIAMFPAHGDSSQSLAQAADRALYHAKHRGRDQVVVYGPSCEDSLISDPLPPRERSSHLDAVILLSEALDLRDISTSAHSQTVARYAASIAEQMGCDAEHTERIRLGGIVHDLGKIGIPDHVLLKPGPLAPGEWKQMQRHPEIGAQILDKASLPDLAGWVLAHHERPDGTGYPQGLSGDAVSLEARILSVADAYEAMTSDRPYRARMSAQSARDELLSHRGTQFDTTVVDALLRTLDLADGSPGQRDEALAPVA
jgi:diguanylate cyclase (GGDEF)-like protein/putative nucleotidyltransferase with HDIG domain